MADDIQIVIEGDDLAGYSATLPTGQTYKGKTQVELLNEVVKAQANSSMTLRQKEQELQDTRHQLEQARKVTQTTAGNEETQFDREAFNKKYWELINTDPLAAAELLNQVYYGVEDPRAVFKKSATVSDFVSDAVATREFLKENEDFPANKANGERVVEECLNAGLELTSSNLEKTWKTLKREGTIQPLTADQIADEQARLNNGTYEVEVPQRRRSAPPNPESSTREQVADTDAAELDNFAVMSKSQREDILRKRGLMM